VRKLGELFVLARSDGVFIVDRPGDLPRNHVRRGHVIGHVMPEGAPRVRVVVPETDIDTVRSQTRRIDVLPADTGQTVIRDVRLVRETPGGTRRLPSPSLSNVNGGPFTPDTSSREADTVIELFFELDLELPAAAANGRWGERVMVRFDHGPTSLAQRFSRVVRQTFLTRFNV
jgi:putative peptide zinc metalloprotease protein